MTQASCATCGATLQASDRYCGNCGSPASAVASAFTVGGSAAEQPAKPVPNPIAVAQMPTVPPPVGSATADEREPRRRGRVLLGFVVVIAVAAVGFLAVTLLSTRDDLKSSRARVAQLETSAATTTTTPETVGGALVPVVPNMDQTRKLQMQIDELTARLDKATAQLATERSDRATDASTATEAATTAAAVQAQLTALQALFPLTDSAFAAADPTGAYAVTLTAGECTLADCTPLAAPTITFTGPAAISGDRINGTVTVAAGTLSIAGTLDPSLAPLCAGVAAPTGYALTLHVSGIKPVGTVLEAVALQGTYTETVSSGDCTGQHRTYAMTLARP